MPFALATIRILDFTRLGFGPQATLILGCLGAEVIRVESATRPDPIRVMPPYAPVDGENQGPEFGDISLAPVAGRRVSTWAASSSSTTRAANAASP